jgi:hypothetical protein
VEQRGGLDGQDGHVPAELVFARPGSKAAEALTEVAGAGADAAGGFWIVAGFQLQVEARG